MKNVSASAASHRIDQEQKHQGHIQMLRAAAYFCGGLSSAMIGSLHSSSHTPELGNKSSEDGMWLPVWQGTNIYIYLFLNAHSSSHSMKWILSMYTCGCGCKWEGAECSVEECCNSQMRFVQQVGEKICSKNKNKTKKQLIL